MEQHVDDTAPGDFALKSMQEFLSRRPILGHAELLDRLELGMLQEVQQLGKVDCIGAIVVAWVALDVADFCDQRDHDQRFEAVLTGVGFTYALRS